MKIPKIALKSSGNMLIKRKIKSLVASLYRMQDDLVESDFDKAETLANQFTSVFTKESDSEWD